MKQHGIIGDILMWSFFGAFAVLIITHGQGFATAIGTVVQPVEYETTTIATAGSGGKIGTATASSAGQKAA